MTEATQGKLVFKNARQIASAGTVQAVLTEVYNLGDVETKFGVKPRVKVIFEITETKDGTDIPLCVSKDFNNSWGAKSSLYKFVQSLLGRPLTSAETLSYDPTSLIGKNALLTIVHRDSNGKVYANIDGVMPPLPGMPALSVSKMYTPFQELRDKWEAAQLEEEHEAAAATAAPTPVTGKLNKEDYKV